MHRRIALAAVACALALPASALASGPVATGAGGVAVQPASGLKVTSLKASRSGRTVTAKVRWDRVLVARKAERERFTVRLVSGPAGQRRVLGTVSRRAPRGTSETVRFSLSARNARRVKGSSRVFATATQQFDSPDTDRLYELNHVAIASMKGKRPFASAAASSCPTEIKPDTDMTGCQLPGANLSGANLLGVIFYKANLEVSNLSGANLRTTNLTQADLTGANLGGATMSDGEQASLTFPDDGAEIGKLIDSAKTSVDVIIYSFGGPNIVGQASSPGPLMRAVSRGVNVRVIVNSGNLDCKTDQEADQSNCLGSPKLDGVYVTEAALKSAADTARAQGKTPGNYRVQFSSQNYQITHQKSILIDTSDKFGNALTEEELKQVPSSQILVSTGNLQSYNWGSFLKWDTTKKGYVVANANYLTDPATSCVAITGNPCPDEWAARDFAIKVTDPKLMARITAVYAADQTCKRWDEAPVYQQLLGSGLADTWANGTLQANGSAPPTSYPAQGTDAFYSGFGPNLQLQLTPDGTRVVPQGNSRQRQLDLIASATTTLVVYNEEMEDADILNALVDAEKRGVDVRVVMSSAFSGSTPTPSGETTSFNFSYLASNGVRIKFFNSNPGSPDLYIHAKAIVADGVNAFMGSENFGYASMNYNRELGLMLTNSTDPQVKSPSPSVVSVGGVAAIMTAFSKDWNSSEAVAFVPLKKVDGPVPQPKPGLPFDNPKGSGKWTYNANCLPPVNGDLFTPKLPARNPPPHS